MATGVVLVARGGGVIYTDWKDKSMDISTWNAQQAQMNEGALKKKQLPFWKKGVGYEDSLTAN